jgi:two-component system LytT family sensor kinase
MNNRQVMYWASQIAGWGLFVLGNILTASFMEGDLTQAYLISAFIFVTGILTTHFFRYLVHRWKWNNLALSSLIPRVVISVVAMSILFTSANTVLVNMWVGEIPISEEFEFTGFLQSTFNFTALFMLWSIIYFAVMTFRNWKREEIHNLELRAAKTEIELNSFKAQMNPHFMFNSLNSIRALVDENPDKAKHAITMLSGILRNNLMLGKKQTVPLREELDLVNKYLTLEKIRFEERLIIEMEISPETFSVEVPAFMLQTIVENGIKHGISKRIEGGRLHVNALIDGDYLVIKVINSGHLLPEERGEGIGINNTKKRLEILYNGKASFDIRTENQEVQAVLVIPINI